MAVSIHWGVFFVDVLTISSDIWGLYGRAPDYWKLPSSRMVCTWPPKGRLFVLTVVPSYVP